MTWTPSIDSCDNYLDERKGSYEYRSVRYKAAAEWLYRNGLDDSMTVVDVGAGMTEFDYCLRSTYGFRGRYIPVDGGIDDTDLNEWIPPRQAHFFVALEILEHLHDPLRMMKAMVAKSTIGVVASTPNPRTTDVLAMDHTHVKEVWPVHFEAAGFTVQEATFYGGVFSNGEPDSLFATWRR